MKKFIFLLLILGFYSGISGQELVLKNRDNLSAQTDELQSYFKGLHLLKDLSDIRNFEYDYDSIAQRGFVFGLAEDRAGAPVIFRVFTVEVGDMVSLPLGPGVAAEACTGVNCGRCTFVDEGGCSTKRINSSAEGPSYCNHSISR